MASAGSKVWVKALYAQILHPYGLSYGYLEYLLVLRAGRGLKVDRSGPQIPKPLWVKAPWKGDCKATCIGSQRMFSVWATRVMHCKVLRALKA